MQELDTDTLAKWIRRKHDCVSRIHELGSRQSTMISQGDVSQLLRLLAAKQRLLGELRQIETSLDPFRGQTPEDRQWRSPQHRDECAKLLARCETLLAEIIAQEKDGEDSLRRRRDEVAGQLQTAHGASRARGAYITAGRSESTRLDLSSES